MKHAYMINGVGGRCLAFVTALSLSACSVLHIDVDEYKGPLSNHEDIQLQQYAALAISAKPIIVELRRRYISNEQDINKKKYDQLCVERNRDDYSGCIFQTENVYFLDSILALYEDEQEALGKQATESYRQKYLLRIELLKSEISALSKPRRKLLILKKKTDAQTELERKLGVLDSYKQKILKDESLEKPESNCPGSSSTSSLDTSSSKNKNMECNLNQIEDEINAFKKKLRPTNKSSSQAIANNNSIIIEHQQLILDDGEQLGQDELDELYHSIIHSNALINKQFRTFGTHTVKEIKNFEKSQSAEYDCTVLDLPADRLKTHDNGRDSCGINRLATNFIDFNNKASVSPQDIELKNKVRVAKERLNESLVLFAEKILFIVNNHSLAFGKDTTNDNNSANNHSLSFNNGTANYDKETNNGYAEKFAVLQSLGNTLIVHANDLRRRAAHDQRLVDRKDSELAAARLAFAPGAHKAFDILVQELGVTIQENENKKTALQNTFHIENITPQTIKVKQKDLADNAKLAQQALDAYRTAFGNYDIKVEGVNPTDRLVASDQLEIASLFSSDYEKNRSADDVLTILKTWFNENKTKPRGAVLLPPAPEYARRNNADDYFIHLFGCNGNSPASNCRSNLGIANGTYKEVFNQLGKYVLVELEEDKLKLEGRQNAIDNESQALIIFNKNESQLSDMTKAREAIKLIKQTVLQQAETAKIDDVFGLRNLLLLELEKQSASKPVPLENDKYLTAINVLKNMPISKSFQFVGGSEVKNQRDVLDDVIAQLQHQRLEAASRGGDITALNQALELAYEQRGGLAYLRSANAYLRNAFANTSLQDSNSNCENLLMPSLFCKQLYDFNNEFRNTKLEIDKQFWQTINTVKVRGGGATDFAIVKDDVGNWYVKGLSSDPESIIKSAQSLALFNMGGKVNLDLLGQVETRRELAKLKLDDPNRQVLKDELKAKQSGSGANTAGLEKVLAKYRKEYVDATTMNVDGLIGKLDQLPTDIRAAWQGINFDETPKTSFEKLTALLANPAELVTAKHLLEASKIADARALGTAKAPASEAANISASDAIVKSLVEVRNMRSRLVKAIIQDDELIAAKRDVYENAKADLKAKDVIVADKKKKWEEADVDVTNKQASLDAMTAPEKIAEKRVVLTNAEIGLKAAQDALDIANKEREDEMNAKYKALENATKQQDIEQKKYDADTTADKDKTALEKATTDLNDAKDKLDSTIKDTNAKVSTKIAERDAADSKKKIQQGIFEGLTASSEIESAKNNLKAAKERLATAKTEWEGADGVLAGSRTSVKGAEDAYTLAKSNRLAAARKVTILADSLIETTAANRLEAVKAYEIAIGFVGQTAGGQ